MGKVSDLIDDELKGLIEQLSDRDLYLLKITLRDMICKMILENL